MESRKNYEAQGYPCRHRGEHAPRNTGSRLRAEDIDQIFFRDQELHQYPDCEHVAVEERPSDPEKVEVQVVSRADASVKPAVVIRGRGAWKAVTKFVQKFYNPTSVGRPQRQFLMSPIAR